MNEPITEQQESTNQRTLREILAEIRGVREAHNALSMAITSVALQEQALKDELREGMEAAGVRTGKASGLMAQLKTRKNALIVDEPALVEAIEKAGLLEEYTRLNSPKAAKAALEHSWPGVVVDEISYLSIGEAK